MEKNSSRNYCSIDGKRFDVLKLILSVFIVAIHTTPVGASFRPIIRISVPLFFIMTSYFFFLNQNKLKSFDEKKVNLWKYVRRILKLYAFWFVILLPITVICRKWYVNFGIGTIVKIFQSFLFSSTFRASWFLMASLINIVFVWYMSRKSSNTVLFVLGVLMYLICCLFSNYYYFIDNALLIEVYHKYVSILSTPFNSFPVALLFVMLGKYLAEHSIYIPNIKVLFLFVLSIVLLFFEFYMIETKMAELYPDTNQLFRSDDSYIFLVPSSLLLFIIVGQNYLNINRETKGMRKCSTVVYCCHCSIATVVNHVLTIIGLGSNFSLFFLITLFFSFFVFSLLAILSRRKFFKFIDWAY